MFKNYLKTAWRNLLKNKVFSMINLLGLTIGITVCLMIFIFVRNEFSFDNFHKNGNRIYRVMRGIENDNGEKAVAYLSGPYATALLNDFPQQIKQAVRVLPTDGLVTIGQQSFHEKKILVADSDFFSLFSFPLIKGNISSVLKDPSGVVLTETTAKKYFGSLEGAMGKTLELNKNLQLKVTGIARDLPSNSHLHFDLVVPLSNYRQSPVMTTWINNGLFTYVLLAPGVKRSQVDGQLSPFMQKYMGSDMKKYGFHFTLFLQPLKEVYFENAAFDNMQHGDKQIVYIFISIAVLILLIACINFTNLSTIRAVERSKEVGLRKVLGAMRKQLIWQFLGESVLLTTISCMAAIGLLLIIQPFYQQLMGDALTISWNVVPVYLFLVGIILVVGIAAGSYPAIFLSAFAPIHALKGKLRLGKGGVFFRQVSVVIQFSISVFLIIGTLIIMKQMRYMQNKQLGYDKKQTIIVPIDNNEIYSNRILFKKLLESRPGIQSVSMMSGEPGGFFDMHMFDVEGLNEKWRSRTEFTDFEYSKTLGLKIIAGRDFSADFPSDTLKAVLINRTAAANLGWTPDQAIGKWLKNSVRDETKRYIIGVVEDFNFLSLKEKMDALVISPGEDLRVSLIKTQPGNLKPMLAVINDAYNQVAPQYPFEYTFLDQKFNELYQKDLRQQKILTAFSLLAIFVACLGLFGLASFAATKRFKEIGVRKVLGATVSDIVVLLSKDLLKPVLIAVCAALPLGYYAMHQWLKTFAYKTSEAWWVYLLAAFITFSIGIVTVSVKAIGAALNNPVDSLRAE